MLPRLSVLPRLLGLAFLLAVFSAAQPAPPSNAALSVNATTGAIAAPVTAAQFRTANGIGGGDGTVTSVSVTTANGVSGSVANATTTPAITLILGAITPTSVNGLTLTTSTGTLTIANGKTLTASNTLTFAGTDGSTLNIGTGGTLAAVATSGSASDLGAGTLPDGRFPATLPAVSGANLTALNASNLASGTVGTARLGSGTANSTTYLRGDQTWASVATGANPTASIGLTAVNGSASTFLRSDGAPALDQSIAPTWTGAHAWSKNSAASAPTLGATGTWFTGGTATTTKPHALIEPTGTTSTGWSTSGTGLGVNAASGFAGNLLDLQVAGTSKVKGDASGNVTATGEFIGVNHAAAATGYHYWTGGRALLASPGAHKLKLSDSNFTTGAVIDASTADTLKVRNFADGAAGAFSAGTSSTTANSAASTPVESITGTWFTGGSATTTKPHVLIEPAGTTSTGWSTSGTGFGVNAASGFAGNLLDLQVAGSSKFSVSATGAVTGSGTINITGNEIIATNHSTTSGGALYWSGRALVRSPGAHKLRISDTAGDSAGVILDASTNGTLKVRNFADNADGNIVGAALSLSGASNALIVTNSQTPASAGATGTVGTICWDSSFIYICVATNTWKRVAIATW